MTTETAKSTTHTAAEMVAFDRFVAVLIGDYLREDHSDGYGGMGEMVCRMAADVMLYRAKWEAVEWDDADGHDGNFAR